MIELKQILCPVDFRSSLGDRSITSALSFTGEILLVGMHIFNRLVHRLDRDVIGRGDLFRRQRLVFHVADQ